jgi:hypothetical protein
MKSYIKRPITFVCLFLGILLAGSTNGWAQKLEKAAFYKAMASDNVDEINQELSVFTDAGTDLKVCTKVLY